MDALIKFYKKKTAFKGASEEDLKILNDLGQGRLPEDIIKFYSQAMPAKNVTLGGFVLYPVSRIHEENINYIPGADIYPMGFFTFASTLDGDAICVDMLNENGCIYQCSHSLLSESGISFYKNHLVELELNYDNIIKCSVKLADNFKSFMNKIRTGKMDSYDVTHYVIKNYSE